MAAALVVLAIVLSLLPWGAHSHAKEDPDYDAFLVQEHYDPDPETRAIPIRRGEQGGGGA